MITIGNLIVNANIQMMIIIQIILLNVIFAHNVHVLNLILHVFNVINLGMITKLYLKLKLTEYLRKKKFKMLFYHFLKMSIIKKKFLFLIKFFI